VASDSENKKMCGPDDRHDIQAMSQVLNFVWLPDSFSSPFDVLNVELVSLICLLLAVPVRF